MIETRNGMPITDCWFSETLWARTKQPRRETGTLRSLDQRQLATFQAQLEADPPRVEPAGRFSFPYPSDPRVAGRLGVEQKVERSYWFEMPPYSGADPVYTIVHVHFSGLWQDYEANPSDDAAGLITQVNVRHSCEGPNLRYEDERFYGVPAESSGLQVFSDTSHGGPWKWRHDQALLAPDPDGFAVSGRPSKPVWVLRLLKLFERHPFYRGVSEVEGATAAGDQGEEAEPLVMSLAPHVAHPHTSLARP